MGYFDLYFNVIKANKEKSLSSWYSHICNLYYIHNNTSDSYDETQRQVQRWVTLTYFFKVTEADEGKRLHNTFTQQFVLLPY